MSDEPPRIREFSRDPIKLWRHANIDCAIYMGTAAPCGYVRVPEQSPLRALATAADVIYRAEDRSDFFQKWIATIPEGHLGHTGLDDVLEAHGGLTWGPSPDGWVGFDTGHAFDIWRIEDLRQWIPEGTEERASFELIVGKGLHMSQVMAEHRIGYEIEWTLDKLIRAVEELAVQVAEVKVEK